MTQAELYHNLLDIGLPVAYSQFDSTEENPAPQLPFITYQFTNSDDMMAENQNYVDISNFDIELYTELKSPSTEKLVEDKLKELNLPYSKIETYIDSEKMFQILYSIQLIGG